ncbi:hypothetical protein A4X20_30165 [Mycolicibacterium iranicum]|uniref:Uncharacterized protein n=1 Tax=Mycolicibacterium iranicum TaxID=912594 RepID=A0A178LDE6_MYCIR|nr:hypothetical protein A4X20_30165 [Mycolicibacterium iranicum]
MSGLDEDRRFLRIELRPGKHVVLSRSACMLALHAAAGSLWNSTPGFIADVRLGSDTTLTAFELVLSGLWRRVEGGYEIADAGTSREG